MSFRYIVIGSLVFAPSSKAGVGVVGPISTSTSPKARAKSAADQLPHLLRLEVVGVVVAGRQHVGAGHDAALHLGAEALAARALVEVEQVARRLAAVAEAHAVEAREVRRAFRRRDDVVGRHRERQARQAHFAHRRRPAARSASIASRTSLPTAGSRPSPKNSRITPTRSPASGRVELGDVVRHRRVDAGRVARVEAGHGAEQQRRVLGRAREHAGLVEARGEGDHPVARHAAVGRLDARSGS